MCLYTLLYIFCLQGSKSRVPPKARDHPGADLGAKWRRKRPKTTQGSNFMNCLKILNQVGIYFHDFLMIFNMLLYDFLRIIEIYKPFVFLAHRASKWRVQYPTLPRASCSRPGRDLAPKTFQGCSFIHLLILEAFWINLGRIFEDLLRFTMRMRTDLTWIFNDVPHRFGVILDRILALLFFQYFLQNCQIA